MVNIQKGSINAHNISFSGHNKRLDKQGYETHNFFYLYDPAKYNCDVELYNVVKDDKGNYSVDDLAYSQPLAGGSVNLNVGNMPEITSDNGFAYRFKLTDKTTGEQSYAFDNGTVLGIFNNEDKYNLVLNNRAIINKNGPMQLIMPDEYYPGMKNVDGVATLDEGLRAKSLASVRTHANKLGGNLFGIISRLDDLQKEGVSRIVGTPFTKDTISSHLYWTENAYRVAPNLGSEEDFKILQQELCKHGINWISDAALVNEGFGGIHMSELLRKGQDAISKNMFRSDERVSLGIIPDNTEHTNLKLINAPFLVQNGEYTAKNPNYDSSKPTYVQFYDERLASPEQVESDDPMRLSTYDNKNTDNIYDITRHDDAVYPFPIEVSPYELQRNAKEIYKQNGKIDLSDVDTIKNMTDFTNFNVVNKSAASGLEVWDGNVDIAKLNFYRADKDDAMFKKLPSELRQKAIEDFDRGALAVRDYAINSGKYWTKLSADTQLEYVSNLFKPNDGNKTATEYMSEIKQLVQEGSLPKSALENIDEEIIDNVLEGYYNNRRLNSADMRNEINEEDFGNDYSLNDYILRQSMDVPLETLPVATNLLGVLTSPYIAKKANTSEELGVSRYDLYKAENPNLPKEYSKTYSVMDNIYDDDVLPLMKDILSDIPNISENGDVTEYGKYVIAELAPDLTKYLLLKAIKPDADVKISEDGKFDFSNVKENEITMQSIGIPYSGKSSKEEATIALNTIKNGLYSISQGEIDSIREKVTKRFENRSLNDFKVAEMVLDRTESGLGWRIDAAKDIAAIGSVRDDVDSMTDAWNNVIDFWKRYNEAVLQENPHAYTTAEITDLYDLFSNELPIVNVRNPFDTVDRDSLSEDEQTMFDNIIDFKNSHGGNFDVAQAKGILTDEEIAFGQKIIDDHKQNLADAISQSQFVGDGDAERKFLEETGITALANYSYFFSLLPEMFAANNMENGGSSWMSDQNMNHELRNKLDQGWMLNDAFGIPNTPGFLFQSPEDGVTNSYTFVGNHDKPRLLHGLSLDMALFHSKFDNPEHKKIAAKCLMKPESSLDFSKVDSKAIAMGSRLNQAFENIVKDKNELASINKAISELASGSFKGKDFDPTAFGTRPLEVAIKSVIDQVHYNGDSLSNEDAIQAKTLENILTPAFDRFYSIYKLLVTLPGSPTDFAGDRVGATGFETKSKNYYQQNRNVIHWEWLDGSADNKYKFVKTFYDNMNQIANLRTKPELSALNDGSTVTLPIEIEKLGKNGELQHEPSLTVQSMLRYNDKGSVVLTLHDLSGSNTPYTSLMGREETKLSEDSKIYNRVVLCSDVANMKQGLKHGLKVGTKFKSTRPGDNSTYKIAKMKQDGKEYYYLKRVAMFGKELPITIKPEDLNTLVLYKV